MNKRQKPSTMLLTPRHCRTDARTAPALSVLVLILAHGSLIMYNIPVTATSCEAASLDGTTTTLLKLLEKLSRVTPYNKVCPINQNTWCIKKYFKKYRCNDLIQKIQKNLPLLF